MALLLGLENECDLRDLAGSKTGVLEDWMLLLHLASLCQHLTTMTALLGLNGMAAGGSSANVMVPLFLLYEWHMTLNREVSNCCVI